VNKLEKLIPFIGRESEINHIHRVINSNRNYSTCIFIDGKGGVGKTRLLNQILKDFSSNNNIFISEIIDFDNTEYHLVQNIMHKLMLQIGSTFFDQYIDALSEYQQAKSMSDESLIQKKGKSILSSFFDNFNEYSKKRRCVLLFDTIDPELKATVWDYIFNEIPFGEISNTVFVFAGREVTLIYDELINPDMSNLDSSHIPKSVELISLEPFEPNERDSYLDLKMDSHGVIISPEIKNKLAFLSQGKPIILDLAADWIIRKRTKELEWFINNSISEMKKSFKDMEGWFVTFNRHLVSHLLDAKNNYDRLTLITSHVFPIDKELTAELLSVDKKKASDLFKMASRACYYKILPDGTISLHDVMRAMIREHVWPFIGEEYKQKRKLSTIAAQYYTGKAKTTEEGISSFLNRKQDRSFDIDVEKKKAWIYKLFALRHVLFFDIDSGYNIFIKLYEDALTESQLSVRPLLLHIMQEYHDKIRLMLGTTPFIDIHLKIIEFYFYEKKYLEAIKKSQALIQYHSGDLNSFKALRVLIFKANSHIRRGEFQAAFKELENAIEISKAAGINTIYIEALNALGWAYRQKGHLKEARKKYLEAYNECIALDVMDENYGWILNNLTFIFSFDNFHQAVEYGESAVKHWQFIENKTGLAAAYLVLAEVHLMHNQNNDALISVDNAIKIFKKRHSLYRIGEGYSLRGAINTNLRNWKEARNDFAFALQDIPHNLIAKTRYRIARLHMFEKRWIEAVNVMGECRKSAISYSDNYYRLHSLAKLAVLSVILKRIEDLEWLKKEYLRDSKEIPEPDEDALSCVRIAIARMYLLFSPPKIDLSIEFLSKGIEAVSEPNISLEVSKNLKRRLERLQVENFTSIDSSVIRQLGSGLKNHLSLNSKRAIPLALTIANIWEKWK
jgi:tetratricopeptide (TPR) repeat protein